MKLFSSIFLIGRQEQRCLGFALLSLFTGWACGIDLKFPRDCIQLNPVLLLCDKILVWFFISGISTSQTHSTEWYQQEAVLRVSLGNFLFFAIFALIMIGVKDQNDRRDSWHHGGWVAKMVIWVLLIILMFFVPNVVISIYGQFRPPWWEFHLEQLSNFHLVQLLSLWFM